MGSSWRMRGRVTILDKDGNIYAQVGGNNKKDEIGTNRTPPAKWREGIVTAPHELLVMQGDIFVAEWNITGRVPGSI